MPEDRYKKSFSRQGHKGISSWCFSSLEVYRCSGIGRFSDGSFEAEETFRLSTRPSRLTSGWPRRRH